MLNVDIGIVSSDHYCHFCHRVFVASPALPHHTAAGLLLGYFTEQVFAGRVRFAAIFVPPSTIFDFRTVAFFRGVVVLVLCAEEHSNVVRQRVTFEQKKIRLSSLAQG